ncbi:MAG: energy transducer TonB [Vicinamibacterales bacterium]
MMSSLKGPVFVAVLAFAAVQPVLAQNAAQQVRDLYASAAYEDTLSAVTTLGTGDSKPAILQYRVFSLVALGRLAEAEQTVELILKSHPRFHPDASDASPRIQELFTKVRGRIGPTAVRGAYTDAKAALDKNDRDAAVALFGEMLQIADDPEIKDQPLVAELRALGAGFMELSRTSPAKPSGPAGSEATAVSADSGATVQISDPIAIKETLPPWNPPNPSSRVEFEGTIHVSISASGTVERAEILKPVHPVYDAQLLRAVKGWLYQPAKRNGVAIPSDKNITVRLKPPA